MTDAVLIGKGKTPQQLLARYANRHGLIAGATGTGKTVSLQILAEGFADLGVPVFATDIKGDLSGIAAAGSDKFADRAAKVGMAKFSPQAYPTIFWDVFGEQGHPIRATISDMGPLLLARLLELSDVQEGVLQIAFQYADDNGLLLLDLKDLRSLLDFVSEHSKEVGGSYGLVGKGSVGAIQRALLTLERAGGEQFFGEPMLKLTDLMRTDLTGRGIINVLAASKLFQQPQLYATFLLWLMSELFEQLPEVGDADRPKLVFFFDEAHLLFKDAPKTLVDKVEQVVRLIRSKGVGIYFITQNPLDLPESVLGQLGNRVQHALRAFTPRDQKAVRAAAETFRSNPDLDIVEVITQMGVGEALVSTLQDKGIPGVVERTLIRPPQSRIGPLTADERKAVLARSPVGATYDAPVDRESAYEKLKARAGQASAVAAAKSQPAAAGGDWWDQASQQHDSQDAARPRKRSSRSRQSTTEAILKSAARSAASSVGRQLGRQLLRGLMGSLLR